MGKDSKEIMIKDSRQNLWDPSKFQKPSFYHIFHFIDRDSLAVSLFLHSCGLDQGKYTSVICRSRLFQVSEREVKGFQ
jgi:hypothetical protein